MSGGGRSQNDTDTLGSGVDYTLDIRPAKRRAVFIAAELGKNQIGYLIDKLFVITVFHTFEITILSPFILPFDRIDLSDAFLVPLFADVGRKPCFDDLFISAKVFCPLPSVNTFAPLCSREFFARVTE